MGDQVGREPQYDAFADELLDHAWDGFWNAYYDRPALPGLLGDVAGKRVLDAACGPCLYAADLSRRGAEVVGSTRPRGWWSFARRGPAGAIFGSTTLAIRSTGYLTPASTLPCARW